MPDELAKLPPSVKQHIQHLERMRRDFIANVSHELRTPLTVIRGYLELLLSEMPIENSKAIYSQMYQHSLRMETLIADLLLLSQLEHDEKSPESEWVDVPQLLEQIRQDAIYISGDSQHQIQLHIDHELKLIGVENELKSLFSNLIINAIKYTPAQGQIDVSWQLKDNKAVFCVKDTGIGIAEEHIPRLTERFYRVDKARSRDSGGTGLGLAIVKHVLIRHQANLTIESEEHHGSVFCCIFPKSRSNPS